MATKQSANSELEGARDRDLLLSSGQKSQEKQSSGPDQTLTNGETQAPPNEQKVNSDLNTARERDVLLGANAEPQKEHGSQPEKHVTKEDAKASGQKVTKVSKLGLLPIFLKIAHTFNKRAVTSPFRGKKGCPSYRRDVLYATMRAILSGFDVYQGQYLTPGTDKVYLRIAKGRKWKPDTVELDDGAKGHWIGKRDAKWVMLYFHGGGYISAATTGHLKWQFEIRDQMKKDGHDLSVLALSYTLAPQMHYPGQIGQAASALRYLIETEKRDPSTILLGGDSAGGNLTAALLLHLSRPHPSLPAPPTLSSPLRAALLISPWVSFETQSPSFAENAESDYITITALNRASSTYVGEGKKHDEYSELISAPVEWWAQVRDKVVRDVFIWGGGAEVLVDGITKFAAQVSQGFGEGAAREVGEGAVEKGETIGDEGKKLEGHVAKEVADGMSGSTEAVKAALQGKVDEGAAGPAAINGVANGTVAAEKAQEEAVGGVEKPPTKRVKLVVSAREGHEEMIINLLLRLKKKSPGGQKIENWLSEVLAQ